MPGIRLFIAVELPPAANTHLTEIQKTLKTSGADAKWVEPQNIHFTLKFLGPTPSEKFERIKSTLAQLFGSHKQFALCLESIGGFPSLDSPRVIWAGLNDANGQLRSMALVLDQALAGMGFEKETREFQAHATLARLRSGRNKIALIEKIKQLNQDLKPLEFSIDNITLFESKLSPHGPTYSILHQVKFL
ncbi:MAG: RNA 2',3'-cyclic phosphodiesterase [Candidatus Omnitrophota bacterium]